MSAARLSLPFRVSWIARMQRSRFDARARTLGLTSAQWRMIAAIRLSEGVSQSEVAAQLEISGVTAGRIIDRLEENGWIERRTNPGDLRANRLYVMPAANPMLERLGALGSDEQELALAGLSPAERDVLAALLDRVIANMVAAPPLELPPDTARDEVASAAAQTPERDCTDSAASG